MSIASQNGKKIPPPPYQLSGLKTGEVLSYASDGVVFHNTVVALDEDRHLPVVEITASNTDKHGRDIVDKLNNSSMRGILLGTCDELTGEPHTPGLIYPDRPKSALAVEMVIDGERVVSVFPNPSKLA